MSNVRLLPVVILAVAALLVLKVTGMVFNGGYVLTGVATAQAAGGGGGGGGAAAPGEAITLPTEPTLEDLTPTATDGAPTLGEATEDGGHGAPAADHGAAAGGAEAVAEEEAGAPADDPTNVVADENACAPVPVDPEAATKPDELSLLRIPADCPTPVDAVPQSLTADGPVPMSGGAASLTEQALLERLAARRAELETYEQELAMRAALVEAAEKRIEDRQGTLEAIETQIGTLVEERKQMEEGQFAGIVAMYETMKPKDAAKIFNALDIEILVRVAKMMSPRKMAPILAEMDTMRAQELTVRLASASQDPLESMTPDDLAALPQIVGQ
ncbi:MAG: hypothetical protein KIT02_05490 [Devosia sp.]|uniref:MotE family protein n=1 Tax=Devosia sp. TaxID=1871048 RepID=UPI0024CA24AC|nr:hypothetical protein [Devosia sp.]UYO00667.1 MAG: hypothetical protein KIT02_05490 [Devosia sp.]